ncbi:MAG: AAA family ATPase [bacterium]
MYKNFYQLAENPFNLTPDPQYLYLSSIHKRAIAYLHYSLEAKKGFSVITGEIGAGKTMVTKAIVSQFRDRARIAHITNPSSDPQQLLRMIAREYEIPKPSASLARVDILEMIHAYLLQQYAAGSKAVLIIDEAQRLLVQSMEEVRLLSNLETEKDKLIHIILVGQPELREILDSPHLRQFRQRVSVWFHILPLSLKETGEYIQHRLAVAGCPRNPFSKGAVKCIFHASGGIPRIINIICDAALLAGYVEQKHTIRTWLVDKVLMELPVKGKEGGEKKFAPFRLWKSSEDRMGHLPSVRQDLELLSQGVNSLYRNYLQKTCTSGQNLPCFPDDLSSIKNPELKDVVILTQIVSLSMMIDAVQRQINEDFTKARDNHD